jgi:ABC-type multidrug transport system fused ATPase/permease subunit
MRFVILVYKIIGRSFLLTGGVVFISGLLCITFELLSIISILPILNTLFNQSDNNTSFYINFISNILGDLNLAQLTNWFIIFVFIFFIFKNIFNIFYLHISLKFSQHIYLKVSNDFLHKKISSDYNELSNTSNSLFLRDVKDLSTSLKSYVELLLNYLIEIFICFFITLFLLFISFKSTVSVLLLLLILSLIYIFYHNKKIIVLGQVRNNVTHKFNSILGLIYNNFIDIKIFQKEIYFVKIFAKINKRFSNCSNNINFRIYITKYIIELVVIVILLLLFSFYINTINISKLLPLVGIYIVSAYRLLPSLNRIIGLRLSLKSHQNTINYFYNYYESNNKTKVNYDSRSYKNFITKKLISLELKNVYYSFNKSKNILKNINLKIKKNQILGLYGGSGVGKTTLVNVITGLIKPDSGKIYVNNKLVEKNLYLLNKISFISQKFFLINDTIKENICFGHKYNKRKVLDSLIAAQALDFLKKKKLTLTSIIAEDGQGFSSGQKQRLALARALYPNPQILILDEATNSLDLETERSILSGFKKIKKEKIIIIISHRKETMKFCDKVIEIKNTRLIET